jgi:hypothetical protein
VLGDRHDLRKGVYLAAFDVEEILAYREHEPHRYGLLISLEVEEPFERVAACGVRPGEAVARPGLFFAGPLVSGLCIMPLADDSGERDAMLVDSHTHLLRLEISPEEAVRDAA